MAITLVQAATRAYGAGLSLAFSSDTTPGTSLFVTANTNTVTGTVSDSLGNVWVPVTSAFLSGNMSQNVYLWWVVSGIGGPCTVTIAGGGTSGGTSFTISEFSGLTSSDQKAINGRSSNGTTWDTGNVTTLFANELMIGIVGGNTTVNVVAAPFTILGTNQTFSNSFYQIVNSIQTGVNANGTMSSGTYSALIGTFAANDPGRVQLESGVGNVALETAPGAVKLEY